MLSLSLDVLRDDSDQLWLLDVRDVFMLPRASPKKSPGAGVFRVSLSE